MPATRYAMQAAGPTGGERRAAADKEPRADDAAERDHRDVPLTQRAAELRRAFGLSRVRNGHQILLRGFRTRSGEVVLPAMLDAGTPDKLRF